LAVTLPPGARLGPYEILALLGLGGMGEVYRAHDTRLNRDVAIKVLPPAFTSDAERRRRFEQEARAAAALSHPNVVAVFDVGVDGDVPYVVSELLEGEDLRRVLARGPLTPRKAMEIGSQVAQGLAAAHQKHVVHRDLKPENIFITPEGRAKILDFGLAKLGPVAPIHEGDTELPARNVTQPGVVLGTTGYMSPEQVRGEETDHRTDIFTFGAVLYEMLTGRRAFQGQSSVETLTAILRDDPPPISSASVPSYVERLIRRCLEKNAFERFQSAGDIAYALEAVPLDSAPALIQPHSPRRWSWPPIAVIGGVAAVALLAVGFGLSRFTAPSAVVSFEPRTFDRRPITNARFMPDGKSIVYSAPVDAFKPELFVIYPDAEAPQPLGVTDAHLLSVSSKGELAIITEARHLEQRLFSGTLSRMTIGSSPRAVLQDVREADWSPDGAELAVVHDLGNGRDRLEFPAGTVLYEASGYLSDLRVSPDGRRVAFFEHQWRFDDRGWVKVVDREGDVTTLSAELWGLQGLAWAPESDTIVFSANAVGGSVLEPMAVSASGRGQPRPVFGVPGRFIVHDVARDGTWLGVREDLALGVRARVPGQDNERELSWLGSSGARGLSRDGRGVLMVDVGRRGGRDYSVVVRQTDASQIIRLGAGFPQGFSPDGTIAAAITAEPPQLLLYPIGAGEPARLDRGPLDRITSASWFPDGTRLFVCGAEPSRAPRCYAQGLSGPPTPVTAEGVVGSLAPDGRTMLLTQPNGSVQVSTVGDETSRPVNSITSGDRQIAWSHDSRAVYVQRGLQSPATVERVDLETGARAAVRRLAPEGVGAVATLYVQDWQEAGPWYAYNYTSLPSTLFVVRGAMK
jgi:serine/threonine protein kinase